MLASPTVITVTMMLRVSPLISIGSSMPRATTVPGCAATRNAQRATQAAPAQRTRGSLNRLKRPPEAPRYLGVP